MTSTPAGLVLSDDLIFTSRITGTARDLGFSVLPARSSEELLQIARRQTPDCVLLDLANPGLVVADLLGQLRTGCAPMPFVVAYGSHMNAPVLKEARAAGCDVVMPRSQFVEELPTALKEWFLRPEK
jgi:CheY-like chemotaxis protein